MKVRIFGAWVVAMALAAGTAFAAGPDDRVMENVVKQVNRYVYFTIFDDISASVDNGVVTLGGKVTMPFKRTDIEKRVAKIDGVREVQNRIEVLPVSQFDDDLRYQIARAIYNNPSFWQYAAMAN